MSQSSMLVRELTLTWVGGQHRGQRWGPPGPGFPQGRAWSRLGLSHHTQMHGNGLHCTQHSPVHTHAHTCHRHPYVMRGSSTLALTSPRQSSLNLSNLDTCILHWKILADTCIYIHKWTHICNVFVNSISGMKCYHTKTCMNLLHTLESEIWNALTDIPASDKVHTDLYQLNSIGR